MIRMHTPILQLFEFGDGLSLTEFSVHCAATRTDREEQEKRRHVQSDQPGSLASTQIECTVKNIGAVSGDYVVLLYRRFQGAWLVEKPQKSLVDFARVSLQAGAATKVDFVVPDAKLFLTTADGDKVVPAGEHTLWVPSGDNSTAVHKVVVASTTTIDTVPRPPPWPMS